MLKTISPGWALIKVEAGDSNAGQAMKETKAGLLIPNSMQAVSFGEIVKIGNAIPYPGGHSTPPKPAKNGDRILLQDLPGIPQHWVTFDTEKLRLIRHHDILGVVEDARIQEVLKRRSEGKLPEGAILEDADGGEASEGEPL